MSESESKFLNLDILKIDKEKKVVKKIDRVSENDIRILKEKGLLSKNFNPYESYLPPGFVKEMINLVREKYPDLTKELPISFVDCSKAGQTMPTEYNAGLTILYDKLHTKLVVRRPLPDGKIEIYVIDSHSNNEDKTIEDAYGDSSKFIVKYPETEKSIEYKKQIDSIDERIKDSINSGENILELFKIRRKYSIDNIGVQMDGTHCISYAVHFARKIYRAVKDEIDNGNVKNAVDGFNKVMDGFKEHIRISNIEERTRGVKERRMFLFPDFLLKYSGSEAALNMTIEARKNEEKDGLSEKLKEKIVPYKNKRKYELDKTIKEEAVPVRKELNEMLDELEKLNDSKDEASKKEIAEKEEEIKNKLEDNDEKVENRIKELNIDLRWKFSPARNWRNKDFKKVVERIIERRNAEVRLP
ncbi:MAG: hypothetical protein LBP39_01160 [Rickettsiales bacterium]|jgi:hypothetical protein|nr:hypothetical protein [Rickettsiales bacterium]